MQEQHRTEEMKKKRIGKEWKKLYVDEEEGGSEHISANGIRVRMKILLKEIEEKQLQCRTYKNTYTSNYVEEVIVKDRRGYEGVPTKILVNSFNLKL